MRSKLAFLKCGFDSRLFINCLFIVSLFSCSTHKVGWEFNVNNPKNLQLVKEISEIYHIEPWQVNQRMMNRYLGR